MKVTAIFTSFNNENVTSFFNESVFSLNNEIVIINLIINKKSKTTPTEKTKGIITCRAKTKGRKDEITMTIFVGVISQKGGVGKSTISRLLAREYAIAKWDVKIADMDISQGTSSDWKKRREMNEIQPYVAVESFRTVSQALKHAQVHDLMIFDGAPHSTKASNEIAQKSDLVILPTGLSLDDLRPTVLLAHELIEAKIPDDNIVFALCRVGDRANEIEEARNYIKKAGYTTLAGSLPEKTAYRRASDEGKAISEVSYLSLRKRADEIVQDIINRITEKS